MEYRQNANWNGDDFKYDPEAEEGSKNTRLPFALCKAHGIAIQDWWTPRNAWDALKSKGIVDNVLDEYKEYFRRLKKLSAKESSERSKRKRAQLKDRAHNPDKDYKHVKGKIAGASKGQPMSFEQADSGHVNPHFTKFDLIGYRHNCQTCVAVYYARRLGYNVRALPNLNNRDIYALSLDTNLAYLTKDGRHPTAHAKPRDKSVTAFLEQSLKNGEIGTVAFDWKSGGSGHIINCEKLQNGKLRIYDPQSNQIIDERNYRQYFSRVKNVKFTKLTGCTMDEKFCDKIMKGDR